jgi:hypothetical protein
MREKHLVKFPNDYYFEEIEMEMDDFVPDVAIPCFDGTMEIFGKYGDLHISIKKPIVANT